MKVLWQGVGCEDILDESSGCEDMLDESSVARGEL